MNASLPAKSVCYADLSRIYRERIGSICLQFIVCCLLFLFSCRQDVKQVAIPDTILPKEKMALVISDIHMAEAAANLKPFLDSASAEKSGFQTIFEKNQITKAQYDASISFYVDHPELLNEVYEQVLNELSKRQAGKQ